MQMPALKINFNRKFQIMVFDNSLKPVRFLGIVKITPVSRNIAFNRYTYADSKTQQVNADVLTTVRPACWLQHAHKMNTVLC